MKGNPELALQEAARLTDAVGIREDAGSNRDHGGWIERFLALCGLGPGYPWCAAFVTWCLVRGGGFSLRDLPAHPASTYYWWTWAIGKGILREDWAGAKRGDLFIWNVPTASGGRVGHVGFILETRKVLGVTWLRTIEGNTNDDGGREGNALLRRGRQGASTVQGWRRVTSKMRYVALTRVSYR